MENEILTLLSIVLVIGLIAGYAASVSSYCQSGAISDFVFGGSNIRLKSWMLALCISTSIMVSAELFGEMDFSEIYHRSTNLALGRLIIGGLIFGIGMAIIRSCPMRLIVRAGRGQTSGFFGIFVVAVVSYIFYDQSALFSPLIEASTVRLPVSQDITTLLSYTFSIEELWFKSSILLLAVIAILILVKQVGVFSLESRGAITIGFAAALLWIITTSFVGEEAREAAQWAEPIHKGLDIRGLSFIGPARSWVDLTISGFSISSISFGVVLLIGVFGGSLLSQLRYGLHIVNDLKWMPIGRQFLGCALQGVGGVLALGCSVGQGVSGLATLSLGSLVVVISMLFSSILTLHFEQKISTLNNGNGLLSVIFNKSKPYSPS